MATFKQLRNRYNTVSEVLSVALSKFGPHGENWIQHAEHGKRDGGAVDTYCMLGAIKATTRGPLQEEAIACLSRQTDHGTIPGHNDRHGRRFPAIKTVMCAAIKQALLEEEHAPDIPS